MKTLSAALIGIALLLVGGTADTGWARQEPGVRGALVTAGSAQGVATPPQSSAVMVQQYLATRAGEGLRGVAPAGVAPLVIPPEDLNGVLRQYCVVCHNDVMLTGNLTLADFDVAEAPRLAQTAEKMIVKLRTEMMPLPGAPRPSSDTLLALVETLETLIDEAAEAHPNPGIRTFQRLNRAEYESSIQDLLGLDIDAADYLPLDTKSANFDNIADVQLLSPTLLNAYLSAAGEVSRLALGAADASASEATYTVSRLASQREQVEGAPRGTRGGLSLVHNFPADGEYLFRVSFHHETTGTLFGNGRAALHTAEAPEQLEISINGERVALLEVGRWMHASDPDGGKPAYRPHPRACGSAAGFGRIHPEIRGTSPRSAVSARLVLGEHEHRRLIRVSELAPPAGSGHQRSSQPYGRLGDDQPPKDFHLSSDGARRGEALRRRDHLTPGRSGFPETSHRRRAR